jgi:hypothetical protein
MDQSNTVTSGLDFAHSAIESDVGVTIRILHIEDDETIAAVAREML